MMLKKYYSKKGFTLIEMMVSLAIFSVVAVVALGALVRIMVANQKAQSLHDAMTNISFALESMSRDLRMGINYVPGTDQIIFESMRSYINGSTNKIDCYLESAYRLKNDSGIIHLQKAEAASCLSQGISQPVTEGDYVDILSPNIILSSDSSITVSNGTYKFVAIRLAGSVGTKEKTKTYFDVQTGVSQRTTGI
jgi:prepilin-type N-terminal cleavage/methylation domain-containing protein